MASPSAPSIVFDAHGRCLRELCRASSTHHNGLSAAARANKRLSTRTRKRLYRLDDALTVLRHITVEYADTLVADVARECGADCGAQATDTVILPAVPEDTVDAHDGDATCSPSPAGQDLPVAGAVPGAFASTALTIRGADDPSPSATRLPTAASTPPASPTPSSLRSCRGRSLRRRAAVHEAFLPLAPACPTRAGVTEESQEAKDGASPPEVLGRPSPSLASTAGLGQLAARVDAALAGLGTATHVDPVVAAQVEVLRAFTAAAFAVGGAPPADRRSPSPRRPRCDAFGTFDVLD